MAEVTIYDVATDCIRPVTQDDVDQFTKLVQAIGLQPPEVREMLTATFRYLRSKKETPK